MDMIIACNILELMVRLNILQVEEDQKHGEEIFSHGIQKNSNCIMMDKVSCLFTLLTLKPSSFSMMFTAMFFTNPHCPKIQKNMVSTKKSLVKNVEYRLILIDKEFRLLSGMCEPP